MGWANAFHVPFSDVFKPMNWIYIKFIGLNSHKKSPIRLCFEVYLNNRTQKLINIVQAHFRRLIIMIITSPVIETRQENISPSDFDQFTMQRPYRMTGENMSNDQYTERLPPCQRATGHWTPRGGMVDLMGRGYAPVQATAGRSRAGFHWPSSPTSSPGGK